ncbi:MAG: hypothetical protein ACRD96_02325 [Bryobacteraceae bacterium]
MRSVAFLMALVALADEKTTEGDRTREMQRQILQLRRVYVDRLTGGDTAMQMRDLLITSLQNSGLFILTENLERADAVLRGAAEDLVYTEVHSSSEGANARAGFSTGRSTRTEGRVSGSVGVGDHESSRSEDRRHEAMATVRLVNKDGDVIWSTTQESRGAKFRGASTDVAEKITRRLVEDYERIKKGQVR